MPISLYLAFRYLIANIKQSGMVMLAVCIGVSLIVFIPSVNLSFFNSFLAKTVENSAHIMVNRELETTQRNAQALAGVMPDARRIVMNDQTLIRRRPIRVYNELISGLMQLEGITAAAPSIGEKVIITRGALVKGVDVQGIIPEREMAIRNIQDDVKVGSFSDLGPNSVMLGWRLADELNVRVGSRITLVTAHGRRSYRVAGLLDSGMYAQDLNTVMMTLHAAQTLLDMPNAVNTIGVKVKDIYDARRLASLIEQRYEINARSWMETNEVFLTQINSFRVIISIIGFLIILAAASSITSILIMVVSAKSKEIGILKAMGTTPGSIVRLFLSYGVLLSMLGAVLGIGGGKLLLTLYNNSPMGKAETILGVARDPAVISWEFTAYAVGCAIFTSIIASFIPAWQASKLDPAKIISS